MQLPGFLSRRLPVDAGSFGLDLELDLDIEDIIEQLDPGMLPQPRGWATTPGRRTGDPQRRPSLPVSTP